MNKQKAIDDVVAKVGDLPAIPEVVGQIIEMMGDPQVSMSELSEQIQRDPALTAKILKISNSAYYGMRQYVSTLKLALVVLGVREVRNIVTGIAVFDTFRDTKADVLVAEGFWRHSLDVASFSKGLG
ncbi:MAG: hypothetical protein QG656_2312, partial [Candidatus Hydrogenedentes bacterium]|nr:hypothetical protein [Candidatus Hydrogenedentota bacterium]